MITSLRLVAKLSTLLSIVFILFATSVRADEAEDNVLPASHSVTPCLYATGFQYADGLVIDAKGTLLVSNYRGNGRIGRITADGTASVLCDLNASTVVNDRPVLPGGLTLDRNGRLIVADLGAGRLLRVSSDGETVEVLADRCNGIRFGQVDDVAVDPKWNIYFTDANGSSLRSPVGSVFLYDIIAGQVSQIATGFANPSGLAVSPDGKLLAVAERDLFRLVLYDLTPDGRATNRRVLIAFPTENEGEIVGGTFGPTGLMFDGQGHIFAAMGSGGLINVIDLETGELVRQYDAGGAKVNNLFLIDGWVFATIASKEAVFRLDLSGQNRHCGLDIDSDDNADIENNAGDETTDEASNATVHQSDTDGNHVDAEHNNGSTDEHSEKPEKDTEQSGDVFVNGNAPDHASKQQDKTIESEDTSATKSPIKKNPSRNRASQGRISSGGSRCNPPQGQITAVEVRTISDDMTSSDTTGSTISQPPSIESPEQSQSQSGIDAILDEETLRSHLPDDPALYDSLHEALQRHSE